MRSLGATAGVMEWWGQCLVEWAQKRNKWEIVPESPLPWNSAAKMRLYLVGEVEPREEYFQVGKKHCVCRKDPVERKSDDSGDSDHLWSNVQQVRGCGMQ